MIHGYILAIFDVPSTEKNDRKKYNLLVKALRRHGFKPIQNSSFLKYQHNMKEADAFLSEFTSFKELKGSLIFIPLVESQYKKIRIIVGDIPDIAQEEAAEII